MNWVKVKFLNSKYDYCTNIATDEPDARDYFTNNYFDRGIYPHELLMKAIDIEFHEED